MRHKEGAYSAVAPVGFDPESEDISPGEPICGVYFPTIQHHKSLPDDFLPGEFNQPHQDLFLLAFLEKPGVHPAIFLVSAIPFQGWQVIFLYLADVERLQI